jgi:hypothetical protein
MAYTVKAGDTLSGLYGADWRNLSGYQGDPTKLQIGTKLNDIPNKPLSINDAQGSTFVPDTSLNPAMTMDLSGIKSTLDGITKNVADLTAQYQQAGETKIEQPKQEKTSVLASLTQPKAPTKTAADYINERKNLQTAFLASQGIDQEDFNQRNQLATQMASLNNQLNMMELQQTKEQDDIRQRTGGTIGLANAEISKLDREYLYKKAMIATQGAGLAAQYQVIQGNIDEANKLFTDSINYANTKERQDVEDYRWALDFYVDADKADKDYLQQQYENTQNELKAKKPELREVGGNLYEYTYNPETNSFTSKLLRSGATSKISDGINTKIVGDFREDGASLKQQVRAGTLTNEEAYAQLRDLYDPSEVTDDYIKQYLGIATTETPTTDGTITTSALDQRIAEKQAQNVKMGFNKNLGIREELAKEFPNQIPEVLQKTAGLGEKISNAIYNFLGFKK